MPTSSETIHNVYEAFARGDIPVVLAALDPNVKWTEAEGFPYGGTYTGPEAVLQNVFMKLGTEWEGFSAVPHEFIVDGETIVALGTYGGKFKATGKRISAPFAHVWKLQDGKVRTFWQHTDTALVQEALR
jgi:ketosteroid isomerase-like protein